MQQKAVSDTYTYAIRPLGKGLPLCTYNALKNHELSKMKLQDFPVCLFKGVCYKELDKKV